MKNQPSRRLARRMPPARLVRLALAVAASAVARELLHQVRQDAARQRRNPTPEFAPAPRVTLLPPGLVWAGPVPALGALVQLRRQGYAQVTAYCHAAGFLGLVVQTPAVGKGAGCPASCVFAHQLA